MTQRSGNCSPTQDWRGKEKQGISWRSGRYLHPSSASESARSSATVQSRSHDHGHGRRCHWKQHVLPSSRLLTRHTSLGAAGWVIQKMCQRMSVGLRAPRGTSS